MQIGMGWLGYTEQQTLDTSIPALMLAWKGRTQMVLAMQGVAPEEESEPEVPTADDVFAKMRASFGGAGNAP